MLKPYNYIAKTIKCQMVSGRAVVLFGGTKYSFGSQCILHLEKNYLEKM